MATETYDDSNWREELIPYTNSKKELELLENGPKSLAQSWLMGALHNKWKKMKGYKDPEPPNVQSSMKEWEQSIKKYENPDDSDIIEEEKDLPPRPEEKIYDEFNDPYGGR
jgi:hypothetical protein